MKTIEITEAEVMCHSNDSDLGRFCRSRMNREICYVEIDAAFLDLDILKAIASFNEKNTNKQIYIKW